jgi:glycosyltransferase involved in cell wall biosynthesis
MSTGLTSYTIAYNLNKIRYPWMECILSVLPVSDEVIVGECFSTDGTYEDLLKLQSQNPKIRILRHPWGDRYEILPQIANMCIRESRTKYHFHIQADEVLHEDSYPELLEICKLDVPAVSMRYVHFIGDFETTFPFVYERVARMGQKDVMFRLDGDACELDFPREKAFVSNVQVFHYGKVHVGRESEAAVKEYEFQQMYVHANLGFPDPKIVEAYKRGRINYKEASSEETRKEYRPFTGSHPKVMENYIREAKARLCGT